VSGWHPPAHECPGWCDEEGVRRDTSHGGRRGSHAPHRRSPLAEARPTVPKPCLAAPMCGTDSATAVCPGSPSGAAVAGCSMWGEAVAHPIPDTRHPTRKR
jgi:hypothetical protein